LAPNNEGGHVERNGRRTGGHFQGKVLNAECARFEIQVGNYRLIAAFNFPRQIAFIKFVGTHAEYDKIDALTAAHQCRPVAQE
jgi:mRNA-degrading endonuclease RelE of RelBE toxin-antitoxin system